MNKMELLAPAGSFESLKAAVNYGADAVYLGGKNYSARAFANNFDNDELIEAIKYAHLRNVKVYVTVNTLLNEKELSNVKKQIDFYYKNNVDALLIQDLGLYYYIKKNYPDFELHCSTQMHVHNIKGINVAKKLGFNRVVIPRESSLEFIKEACKQGIEIETFVHGAICVSYSGQCLMSSVTKNRSANKGTCAQCCRLKYDIFDEANNKLDQNTKYLLSTKDMCLIDRVPDLIKAGVSSIKIEGRMKSSAYVGYVTSLYRKAIDSYYDNSIYKISDKELYNLKVLFNRNFTDTYLDNSDDLFGQNTPNHLGVKIGDTVSYRNGNLYIKLIDDLNQFDGIRINDFGCIVNFLYKDGLLVNSGKKGDIVSIKSENINGSVYKTLDYNLEKSINEYSLKKLPLNINIDFYPEKPVHIRSNVEGLVFDYYSEITPETALNKPINEEILIKQFKKLGDSCYFLNDIKVNTGNSFLNLAKINEIRRDFILKLDEFRLNSFNRMEILSQIELKDIENDQKLDPIRVSIDENLIINPLDIQNNDFTYQFGDLLDSDKNSIFYSMNCMNSSCYEFYKSLGYTKIILSSEIKNNEIEDLINEYTKNTGRKCYPYVYKDGSRVLMFLKGNIISIKKDPMGVYTLTDGANTYKYLKHNNIYEIRENKDNVLVFEQYI